MDRKGFYIDVDKTKPNWTYTLRYDGPGCALDIGCEVANFNPYFLGQRGGTALAYSIAKILNDELAKDIKVKTR